MLKTKGAILKYNFLHTYTHTHTDSKEKEWEMGGGGGGGGLKVDLEGGEGGFRTEWTFRLIKRKNVSSVGQRRRGSALEHTLCTKKISLTSMSQALAAPPGVRTGNSNLHNAKMFACFKVVGSDRGGEGGGGGRPFLRRPDVFCNRPARDSWTGVGEGEKGY